MRSLVAMAVTSLLVVGVSMGSDAEAAIKRFTNIEAQALEPALKELARQRDFQLVYRSEVVGARGTAGAAGELTAEEALRKLLEGTGLTYRYLDEKTVTIVPLATAPTVERKDDGAAVNKEAQKSRGFWDRFRVARADSGKALAEASDTVADSGNASAPVKLEEIVVTAQKREERAIDVPISIVAIGGEELRRRQITNVDDLALGVPGLSIQSNANRRITLRGVSNVFGNSSLIGMYLDEADVTSTTASQLELSTVDLERVEVLRGPQGTLYGQGASGGIIRMITRDPDLEKFSVSSDVSALFTEHGEPGGSVNGVVNMPLVDGKFGLRLAGTYDHSGGWIDEPAAGKSDINGQNLSDVRLKALWAPNDALRATGLVEIHRNNKSTNTGEDSNGNYTQLFDQTTVPGMTDDHDIYNGTLSYDFDAFRILSSTSYIRQTNEADNYGAIQPLSASGTPALDLLVESDNKAVRMLTQEVRVSSSGAGPWKWLGGVFYRDFKFVENEFAYLGLGPALPPRLYVKNTSRSKSWAVFGDSSYQLTERFSAGAGVRYFRDDLDSGRTLNATVFPDQSGTFSAVTPRAYVEFRVSPEANVYASAAKGFRSGGFNTGTQPPYDPESVWTYELGLKTSALAGELTANLALFYSDYTNYQINGIPLPPAPPVSIASNAGSAFIRGVEWDFTWRPASEWVLGLRGNYADSAFYEILATSTAHAIGDSLDLFPKYQFTVTLERDFTLHGRPGYIRTDYNQQGRQPYRVRSNGDFYFSESDVINMLNLSMGLQWNDSVSIGLFGRNLLDDRGYTDPFSIQATASRSRPRAYGVEFGVRL
jgi:outer membrane receptor protein involved in Fe transport